MRARTVGFKRTGDPKTSLGLGFDPFYKLKDALRDSVNGEDIIQSIEKYSIGGYVTVQVESKRASYKSVSPKPYVKRLFRKHGLDKYLKFIKVYNPRSLRPQYWFKPISQYKHLFPVDFYISKYDDEFKK